MKLAIEGVIERKPVVFRLRQVVSKINLEIDWGKGFIVVATFDEDSEQAFVYADRMTRAGFRVYDGKEGQVL